MPFVSRRSLTPKGMPWRGPRYLPAAISASARFACSNARSRVSVMVERGFVWGGAGEGEYREDLVVEAVAAIEVDLRQPLRRQRARLDPARLDGDRREGDV